MHWRELRNRLALEYPDQPELRFAVLKAAIGAAGELVTAYADASLDIIDASTIAAAERLNQTTIATLDERDFRIVRPAHTDAFDLLPGPA